MTYFPDLSDYEYYYKTFDRPVTKNIGWLGFGHDFPTETPTEALLDKLFEFGLVAIAQARGRHICELCDIGIPPLFERNGKFLDIGSSEIRVFSTTDVIYAAPNLIYHYVKDHHYKPPDEFVHAVLNGPAPPSQAYFDRLKAVDLDWSKAWGSYLNPEPDQRS